jgi:outer membrane lipoprotein-sorting protein
MKRFQYLILVSILLLVISYSVEAKNLTADKVMENVVMAFESVQDFTVNIEAEVQMEGIQVPHMKALLYFKKPDKIHFSSQQFLMVPREGIVINPEQLRNNYDAAIVQEEKPEHPDWIKLQLAASKASVRVRQMSVWIDPANWTIVKMETVPYNGRTLSLLLTYAMQDKNYWLPKKVVVSFGAQTESPEGKSDFLEMKAQALSDEHQRPAPRGGSVTVTYSNYKINAGIDDAVFVQEK